MRTKRLTRILIGILVFFALSLEPRALNPVYAASKGKGPVAYWRFDEGGGSSAYDQGWVDTNSNGFKDTGEAWSNNTGTLTPGAGGTNTAAGQMWTRQGKVGGALECDGTDDYVDLGSNKTLSSAAWSVSLWFKNSEVIAGNLYNFIGDNGWITNSAYFCVYNSKIALWNKGGQEGAKWYYGNTTIVVDTWYQVILTSDGSGNYMVYLNGVLDSNWANMGTDDDDLVTQYIGRGSAARYYKGFIDDVKIYTYARTADQIMVDYNASMATYSGAGTDPNEGNPPIGYWPMNENTGATAYDRSGNGNNGTVTNAVWAQGKRGGCLSFDGSGDTVAITDGSLWDFGTGDFTIGFWFTKIDTVRAHALHFGSGSNNLDFDFDDTGYGIWVYWMSNGSPNVRITDKYNDGSWHYLSFTRAGNVFSLYVDGIYKGGTTVSSDIQVTGGPYIGSNGSGVWWNGKIDEVKIYNYARSVGQIAYDYNKCKPVAQYRFDEGGGPIAKNDYSSADSGVAPVGWWMMDNNWNDSSGNGKNGTAYNQAAFSASSKIGPYCGTFDGTGDYVGVGTVGGYSSVLTVEAWVNHSAAADWDDIVAGGCGDILFGFSNNQLSFGGQCNSPFTPVSYAVNINGAWHHVVGVYNGSTAKLYVDGVEVASSGKSGSFTPGAFNIGGSGVNESFTGQIDDVRIYNYARTAEQIYNDYKTTHGTLVGDTKFVDGKIGKALQFDGSGDYVTFNATGLPTGTQPISMFAWIKTTNANRQTAVSYGSSATGQAVTLNTGQLASNGNFVPDFYSAYADSGVAINDGNWHHIGFSFAGNTSSITMYVDGKAYAGTLTNTPNIASGTNGQIGRWVTAGSGDLNPYYFNGSVDDVRIYNYARTADQVMQDYNAGTALQTGGQTGTADPWGGAMPVGYWRLDENTGVLAQDSSGNGNNGTLGGDGAGTDVPIWTQGKNGSSLKFDGNNDYVEVPGSASLNITDQITMEAWAYFKGQGAGNHCVFSKKQGSGLQYGIGRYTSNYKFFAGLYAGAWTDYASDYVLNDNQWYHLASTYDRQNVKLYVNGVLVKTIAETDPITGDSTNRLTIGADAYFPTWNEFTNAIIDDIKIYNYARTQAQIAWDYNKGKPVGYWRFDEATSGAVSTSTGAIKDDSGSYNGTASATTFGYTAGKFGGALSFDGNDYVTIQDNLSLSGMSQLTQEAWVYMNSFSGSPVVMGKQNSYDLYFNPSGTLMTDYKGASGGTVPVSQWTHIAMTYDGSNTRLFVNGAQTTISANSGNIASTSTPVEIGRWAQSTEYVNGTIDDVRIYNYARTADQVLQDFNAGMAAKTSGD